MTRQSTDKNDPVFLLSSDLETLTFESITVEITAKQKCVYRQETLSSSGLYRSSQFWAGKEQSRTTYWFCIAAIAVIYGDRIQRYTIERIKHPKTRNIKTKTERPQAYYRKAMKDMAKQDEHSTGSRHSGTTNQEEKSMKKQVPIKEVNDLFRDALAPIRKMLGLQEDEAVGFAYKMTDRVIASARTEQCKNYLEPMQAREVISPNELKMICKRLKTDFEPESGEIITALRATKTRDHIAAMSISGEMTETTISMANIHGQVITLESWRFLKLIERAEEPTLLHESQGSRFGGPQSSFEFNNLKFERGQQVVGKFDKKSSAIEIIVPGKGREFIDYSSFIVDSDYVLCIYIVLKRLHEDKKRFAQLKEDADSTISAADPFRSITKINR